MSTSVLVRILYFIGLLGERDAPRFHICVRRSSNGERNMEVCPGEEQAGDEAAGTRDQRREDAHEGDAAAGGGTHFTQEDDMRWKPNDDCIVSKTLILSLDQRSNFRFEHPE